MSTTVNALRSLEQEVDLLSHDGTVCVAVGSDYSEHSRHMVILGAGDREASICLRLTPTEATKIATALLFNAEEARSRPTRVTEQLPLGLSAAGLP